jgi:4-amino-4-deoxychorismate lyase
MLVNGQQLDSLSLLDRGLQYGDGLFETISLINGVAPLWDRHYARLQRGCELLAIEPPAKAQLHDEIMQVGSGVTRAVVKIIVTRATHGHGYFPALGQPTRIVMRMDWVPVAADSYRQGIAVHLCSVRLASGSVVAGIKHLNRLEQVLAAQEIAAQGCSEGILCDVDGNVIEGLMANLFWVSDGQLFTPPIDRCGVAGVMRAEVMAMAESLALTVHEKRTSIDAIWQADACFLTSAVKGIVPIKQILDATNSPAIKKNFSLSAIPAELRQIIDQRLAISYE